MRLNVLIFFILFLIFSFFITINLFFERSFQKEALELTHRELGLLTHNLSEKMSFILNLIPKRYFSLKNILNNEDLAQSDSYIIFKLIYEDFKSLAELYSGFKVYEISTNIRSYDLQIDLDFKNKRLYYLLPFKINKHFFVFKIELNLDEIFNKHIKPIKLTESGYAWIISTEGDLIYHPTQPDMVGNNILGDIKPCLKCHKDFDAEKAILKEKIKSGYQYYYSHEKKDKIIYYSKLELYNKDWILCVSVPYNEILAFLNKSMKLHSLIVISIFLSLVILGTFFYYINMKRIAAEEKVKFFNFLHCIIESIQSKLVVLDKNFKILLANTAYAKLLKKSKEEIIGIDFFEICPQKNEEYRQNLKMFISEAFYGKTKEFIGYPMQDNGELKYYHLTVNPLKESDQLIGVVLTCDDISSEVYLREELKKYTEELEKLVEQRTKELHREKEKLTIIMETVNTGIAIINEKGTIYWMNPKMEEIFKLCKKDKGGLNKFTNFAEIFKESLDYLPTQRFVQFIAERFCSNQRFVFQVQITPIMSDVAEKNFICLVQDITELKLMEEKIMQSEKLQALARISAGLAHEIGNPLTSISSYVQVLKEMDLGEFPNQALEVISKHILRISEIIRNISSFAKPAKGEVIPIDVNEVIESTVNLVKFDKRMREVKIILNLNEVPKVLADPNQLSQVFINLILNAGDAMPEGGELYIETKESDNFVEINFTDTGTGIPAEHLPLIFDPFFTTKEKGTGFGLAVSYSIIKNFGGDITVESELGKGSTFTVKLPIYANKRGE